MTPAVRQYVDFQKEALASALLGLFVSAVMLMLETAIFASGWSGACYWPCYRTPAALLALLTMLTMLPCCPAGHVALLMLMAAIFAPPPLSLSLSLSHAPLRHLPRADHGGAGDGL